MRAAPLGGRDLRALGPLHEKAGRGIVFGRGHTNAARRSFSRLVYLCSHGPAAAEPAVPAWFKPDPKNPYAIFDAWRSLSTTEAALYWGQRWNVFAGVLRDERGRPIANSPLLIGYSSMTSGCSGELKTDKEGYFIIYSPPPPVGPQKKTSDPLLDRLNGEHGPVFSAALGCPFSPMGIAYAFETGKFKECTARAIHVSNDRIFYVLTCPRKACSMEKSFTDLQRNNGRSGGARPQQSYVAPLKSWNGPGGYNVHAGAIDKYVVRVISPKGCSHSRRNDSVFGLGLVWE